MEGRTLRTEAISRSCTIWSQVRVRDIGTDSAHIGACCVMPPLPRKSALITVSKVLGLCPEFNSRKFTAILNLGKVDSCLWVRNVEVEI